MLILHETPAGFALFTTPTLSSTTAATSLILKQFHPFRSTAEATRELVTEGMTQNGVLEKFLTTQLTNKGEVMVVDDHKLGSAIQKKFGIKMQANDEMVAELYRGIRKHAAELLPNISQQEMNQMVLGLSHSMSRYKLKFSTDKVDTMVVQAIALLDDLDKELNTYAMRTKEWYGWHFPEMGKIINDNLAYAKVVKRVGFRTNFAESDLSDILPDDLEETVKAAAEISMGTEISDLDILNITSLSDQVISITEYRSQLYEYLKSRMNTIAPNLTALVGELVGARLISHAGSLMNLAKFPASTVQILGAEKALFRALKTKKDTPKYGLIYHASLVGQAAPKNKGKIARVLAAKAAISLRYDALGETDSNEFGSDCREKVEYQLKRLDMQTKNATTGRGRDTPGHTKSKPQVFKSYNTASDILLQPSEATPAKENASTEAGTSEKKVKKEKKSKKGKKDEPTEMTTPKEDQMDIDEVPAIEAIPEPKIEEATSEKKKDKKSKKSKKATEETQSAAIPEPEVAPKEEKKDKKDKKEKEDKKDKSEDSEKKDKKRSRGDEEAEKPKKKKSKKSE